MKKLLFFLLLFPLLAGAQQVNNDIIPASTGLKLGHSNQRWNGFFQNIDISGTCLINGVTCGSGSGSGMIWPLTPGIPVCINTPCTAWGTTLPAPDGNAAHFFNGTGAWSTPPLTTIQTNGTPNTAQSPLNFQTSTTNAVGLTVTPSNPSAGNELFEITGSSYTGNAATATSVPAAGVAVGALGNGMTATTQAAADNSTKVATTAYTDRAVAGDAGNFLDPGRFVLSRSCPTAASNCFPTFADTLQVQDCSWVSGTADVTCTNPHFASTDCVGGSGCTGTGTSKRIFGFQNCATNQAASAYVNGLGTTAQGAVTIATFVSSTHVTVSQNAAASQTAPTCMFFGHPDDTATTSLDAAAVASPVCPHVQLASAGLMWTASHFTTQNTACTIKPDNKGQSYYEWGFELSGDGASSTNVVLTPDFPFSSAPCSTTGCFGVGAGMWVHDWTMTGGALILAANGPTAILWAPSASAGGTAYARFDNFACNNIGAQDFNMRGLLIVAPTYMYNTTWDGCGGYISVTAPLTTKGSAYEDSAGNNTAQDAGSGLYLNTAFLISSTGQLVSLGGNMWAAGPLANGGGHQSLIVNQGGIAYFGTGDYINTANSGAGVQQGYLDSPTATNCVSSFIGTKVGQPSPGTTALTYACTGGVSYLTNAIIYGTNAIIGQTHASTITMSSTNKISGTINIPNSTSILNVDGSSLTGTCTGTVPSSSTVGLYGTGPNVTTTACATTVGLGVPMTGSGTIRMMACSASAAGVAGDACTVLKNGSTTTSTCVIGTTTYCVDNTHLPTFVAGDLLSCEITTGGTDTLANPKCQIFWFH